MSCLCPHSNYRARRSPNINQSINSHASISACAHSGKKEAVKSINNSMRSAIKVFYIFFALDFLVRRFCVAEQRIKSIAAHCAIEYRISAFSLQFVGNFCYVQSKAKQRTLHYQLPCRCWHSSSHEWECVRCEIMKSGKQRVNWVLSHTHSMFYRCYRFGRQIERHAFHSRWAGAITIVCCWTPCLWCFANFSLLIGKFVLIESPLVADYSQIRSYGLA